MTREDRKRLTWETLRAFLRLAGPEQLLEVFLLTAEDSDAWSILRDILLVLRNRVPDGAAFELQRTALDRLYLLTRFVEFHERFPNPEEEGLLFQSSESLVTMISLLRSRMSSVRERLLRRLDLKRKWRGSIGVGMDVYPRGDPLPPDEYELEEDSDDSDLP